MNPMNDQEIDSIVGGFGPDVPDPEFEYECPNLERFIEWRRLNPM